MTINKKVAALMLLPLFFVMACGSASSSDSKKVVVNQEESSKAEKTQQAAPAKIEKPAPVKQKAETSSASEKTDKTMKVSDSDFIEGKHYVKISPEMQTDAPEGKVEVIELMWLGCPHCYNLEPRMLEYKKNHPDFVDFKQVPAMLNASWANDAKTYYLAEILDPSGEKELITQLFQAIHEQRRNLRNPDTVMRLFKQFGYTEEQVNNVKNSMAFQAKLRRAEEIGTASKADSVPAIIVNGKYRTSVYMAGSEDKLFKVVKMLTEKEHK